MKREEAAGLIKQMLFTNYSFKLDDDDKEALIEAIKVLEMPKYYGSMRPRGEWICIYRNNIPNIKYGCSQCEMVVRVDSAKDIKHYRFCPHCGAIMEANE